MRDKGESGERGGSRIDAQGIKPPRVYSIDRVAAPDGIVLLALEGEFDLAAAPATRERFERAVAERPRAVVADLSEVTFMDSSALRELLRADRDLEAAGIEFLLAGPPPQVERVLDLTRARELLSIAATVSEAFARAAR
jgi:anti-anti-sigma factor